MKRLEFVSRVIRERAPRRVLDMGCGTGARLTAPLAERFPEVAFLGVDTDEPSIEAARATAGGLPNVSFARADELSDGATYDLVLAAEVLEHVEDTVAFLDGLVRLAGAGGRLVVTVPNGYGPFELCALIEVAMNLTGVQALLRAARNAVRGARPGADGGAPPGSLAVSPHLNFFSHGELLRLFEGAGCRLRAFQPTTFLCGYGLDALLKGEGVIAWNARIADRLPRWCASDWMFELEPGAPRRAISWRASALNRARRGLNRRRWGLA